MTVSVINLLVVFTQVEFVSPLARHFFLCENLHTITTNQHIDKLCTSKGWSQVGVANDMPRRAGITKLFGNVS
jgi:hypothetical protein